MKCVRRVIAAAGTLCLLGASVSQTAPLLDQVQLVGDTAVAGIPVPPAQTFTVTQAGSYVVTLTDLQVYAPLALLSAAIVNSTTNAVTLAAAGTQTVTLQAGTYTAQSLAVAATGAAGGAFGLEVTPAAGGTALLQYEYPVGPASSSATPGQSALSAKFTVSAAGTYQLTLTDLAFPAALSSLSLIILNDCGTTVGCTSSPVGGSMLTAATPSPVSLSLSAGTYDLFVAAVAAGPALQGLYSVQTAQGSTIAYANTLPVGQLPASTPITIPSNGTVALNLVDLAFPAALTSVQAIVTQGGSVLQSTTTVGSATFTAVAGTAQLYVLAMPGSGGQGAYEAYLTQGGSAIADIAQTALSRGNYGFAFPAKLAAGGSYELSVYDFMLPQAFNSLSAVVAQAGTALTTTQGSSNFTAAAGPLNVLVFPDFPAATAASDNGLIGVQINASGSGASEFETTQGVGALFNSQTVTVTSAGSYDLSLTDLGFPAKFSSLAVIATRGDAVAGQVFGGGKLTIAATPGSYVLNVLTEVGSGVDYGFYGLQVAPSPPAPTATLSASSSNISSGKAVTLTWGSTGANSCSASASPSSTVWTGTLAATSGTLSAGALTATTTFTLSCNGDGGTATAAASVTVTPAASGGSKGGGGIMSRDGLLVLTLALVLQITRRRARVTNRPQ